MIKVFIDENTDVVKSVAILGGCHGNLTAIMRLLKGRSVKECVDALKGIKCGRRGTSCPDQVAVALEMYLNGLPETIEICNGFSEGGLVGMGDAKDGLEGQKH